MVESFLTTESTEDTEFGRLGSRELFLGGARGSGRDRYSKFQNRLSGGRLFLTIGQPKKLKEKRAKDEKSHKNIGMHEIR